MHGDVFPARTQRRHKGRLPRHGELATRIGPNRDISPQERNVMTLARIPPVWSLSLQMTQGGSS